jgi:hypothetical protein
MRNVAVGVTLVEKKPKEEETRQNHVEEDVATARTVTIPFGKGW